MEKRQARDRNRQSQHLTEAGGEASVCVCVFLLSMHVPLWLIDWVGIRSEASCPLEYKTHTGSLEINQYGDSGPMLTLIFVIYRWVVFANMQYFCLCSKMLYITTLTKLWINIQIIIQSLGMKSTEHSSRWCNISSWRFISVTQNVSVPYWLCLMILVI